MHLRSSQGAALARALDCLAFEAIFTPSEQDCATHIQQGRTFGSNFISLECLFADLDQIAISCRPIFL